MPFSPETIKVSFKKIRKIYAIHFQSSDNTQEANRDPINDEEKDSMLLG
jgi:hypothetical protein